MELELLSDEELLESVKSDCQNLRRYRRAYEKNKCYSTSQQLEQCKESIESFSGELRARMYAFDGGVPTDAQYFSEERLTERSAEREPIIRELYKEGHQ